MISPSAARSVLRKISGLRVLVIGDVMLDHYIWGDATRISPEAPVPVVDIARDTYTAGGAANVALNLASLGAKATVAGHAADDEAGQRLRGLLKASRIQQLDTQGTGATIVKTRVLVQHQQLCRLDREAPPDAYRCAPATIAARLKRAIRDADAIILSDYAKGLINDDLVRFVHDEGRRAGCFLALDPKPKRPLQFSDLDLITPNRREALQLSGITQEAHQPFPAAAVCAELNKRYGTRHLVITLSEDGLLLSAGGKVGRTIPTAAREVFDVSGAGDTALASLTLALAAGVDLETAAQFSNACAGVVVGKLGTATVTPRELLAYVRS
ncbi:bifunctional heptose 7-phosphate kinase/heptose 1-phosphate adenyltransferase [Nibricoccus sp. IMCC34717]|uniref:bifunctional heptose 7-phosphate kinase/heptose 1-phosphate adenyltransferase n=1 Tax=Nibricoccus sp. IMCC34717 TaxID=3034021 RepID=UPI00384BA57B